MANKSNGVEEWVRAPPPEGSVWERTAKVIYNPQEKSFLGRTPKRWAILFTFYLVFYTVLALMFALCMGGLFLSLDESRPTYILHGSLIGSTPGVSHRPLAPLDSVVRYRPDNGTHYEPYVEQLRTFFIPYSNDGWYSPQTECVAADNYGYPDTPCFFVKVNKIIGWNPDFYDDATSLPKDMPEDLSDYIRQSVQPEQKQIWISCGVEDSNGTKIEYPWGRGLSGDFYPYVNREGYRSPLVAVRITSAEKNYVVTIRCRAWARNIVYNKSVKYPTGYTRFQLYIEDDTAANATEPLT